jgi:hypothetical protein
MRKVLITTIIAASVVLLAGVAWTGWGMWSEWQDPSPALRLKIKGTPEVAVLQGTPLIFAVSLTGSKRRPQLRIGSPGHPWYSHLTLQLVDGKQILPWKLSLLSPPESFSYQHGVSEGVHFDTTGGDEALVNAEQLYSVEFGIDPQEAARIHEGHYRVSAVLKLPYWPPWRWARRVASKPVTFVVVKQDDTATSTAELRRRRLVKSIEFYLQARQFDNAYTLALQLKQQEPKTIYSYLLLGDALNGLRCSEEALKAYDYALHLAALENAYEPPEYLLIRRYEVEWRLEGRR